MGKRHKPGDMLETLFFFDENFHFLLPKDRDLHMGFIFLSLTTAGLGTKEAGLCLWVECPCWNREAYRAHRRPQL